MTTVFQSDKDRLKEAIKEATADYIDMLDCVGDSIEVGLIFEVEKYGCKIKIEGGANAA